jgi:hypothetical protein
MSDLAGKKIHLVSLSLTITELAPAPVDVVLYVPGMSLSLLLGWFLSEEDFNTFWVRVYQDKAPIEKVGKTDINRLSQNGDLSTRALSRVQRNVTNEALGTVVIEKDASLRNNRIVHDFPPYVKPSSLPVWDEGQ